VDGLGRQKLPLLSPPSCLTRPVCPTVPCLSCGLHNRDWWGADDLGSYRAYRQHAQIADLEEASLKLTPRFIALIAALLSVSCAPTAGAASQQPPAVSKPAVTGEPVPGEPLPGDAVAKSRRTSLRFLTTADFPPFNYTDEEGELTGFNIEFARAVCVELEVSCQFKAVGFDDLTAALGRGDGDAVAGGLAATAASIEKVSFSRRYYFLAAHFAVRKDGAKPVISAAGLEGRKIAVVAGSSHEAYLKAFFPDSQLVSFPTNDAARGALAGSAVDAMFGDGLALAFWTNGTSSKACCELAGGAYHDERYFGNGVAIAVRKDDPQLERQVDAAIATILSSKHYEEMLARYFPVRLF